ncbi:ABC transporter ATP-binding protein [Billgrantia kenyensis]|uniref:ABC transporter ATP-binding protein n=1 Tax=Billgrantia kenyensis TaxID=321266 RepID=A0A7W0AEV4_9GAMM|nr:ABC transporter ATP-binding protein [Halomonas kenyensis]MBA2780548.1 ABC transporter ATP-binding protein [Halomonas kenyensis]MCG6663468.1 ABC transporter ATP-binding protein [Halomonas kenyensis]
MLELRNVSAAYGQHLALQGIDLQVRVGEMVVMLGANGAGKSTLLSVISGQVPARSGSEVQLEGIDLLGLPPHEVVEAGIALVPEGRGIFGAMTVRENLLLGAYPKRARAAERRSLERVMTLFPKLEERLGQVAGTMSGGEQQMVAIGRALMSAPRLLLLDEPSLGLSPLMAGELFKALERIREIEVSVLFVEQNARKSLAIADRGYLIENGAVVGEGTAEGLLADDAVQQAYLGLAKSA